MPLARCYPAAAAARPAKTKKKKKNHTPWAKFCSASAPPFRRLGGAQRPGELPSSRRIPCRFARNRFRRPLFLYVDNAEERRRPLPRNHSPQQTTSTTPLPIVFQRRLAKRVKFFSSFVLGATPSPPMAVNRPSPHSAPLARLLRARSPNHNRVPPPDELRRPWLFGRPPRIALPAGPARRGPPAPWFLVFSRGRRTALEGPREFGERAREIPALRQRRTATAPAAGLNRSGRSPAAQASTCPFRAWRTTSLYRFSEPGWEKKPRDASAFWRRATPVFPRRSGGSGPARCEEDGVPGEEPALISCPADSEEEARRG